MLKFISLEISSLKYYILCVEFQLEFIIALVGFIVCLPQNYLSIVSINLKVRLQSIQIKYNLFLKNRMRTSALNLAHTEQRPEDTQYTNTYKPGCVSTITIKETMEGSAIYCRQNPLEESNKKQ